MAEVKRRAYREWEYWGKPVPPFGDPARACSLLVWLRRCMAATGRTHVYRRPPVIFLYRALYETGFASQPQQARGDGLELTDAYITAA